jgi:hypothetical protein
MSRIRLSVAAASCSVVAVAALLAAQGPANEFKPDTTFTGSSLTGWTPLGAADGGPPRTATTDSVPIHWSAC